MEKDNLQSDFPVPEFRFLVPSEGKKGWGVSKRFIESRRSKFEDFGKCQRYGYLVHHFLGKGIEHKRLNVPLATGTFVHEGIAFLMETTKLNNRLPNEEEIDAAVTYATSLYKKTAQECKGFVLEYGPEVDLTQAQKFTYREQIALTEALIRVYALGVLPRLWELYEIVIVEKQIDVIFDHEVWFHGVADAVLKNRESGQLVVLSLKTAADYDKRKEETDQHDTQGLTESWLVEYLLREMNEHVKGIKREIEHLTDNPFVGEKLSNNSKKFAQYVAPFGELPTMVEGVLMVHLRKGSRKKDNEDQFYKNNTPLLYGYRKLTGTEFEYAHSWYYPKPENKSGQGALGRGWEKFAVFEPDSPFTVKQWVHMLAGGQVQADCPNPVTEATIVGDKDTWIPYYRNAEEMASVMTQIVSQEKEINVKVQALEAVVGDGMGVNPQFKVLLDESFPQNRRACFYPGRCGMVDVCFTESVGADPLGSGFVKRRGDFRTRNKKEMEDKARGEKEAEEIVEVIE